jgi:hypothetical protein
MTELRCPGRIWVNCFIYHRQRCTMIDACADGLLLYDTGAKEDAGGPETNGKPLTSLLSELPPPPTSLLSEPSPAPLDWWEEQRQEEEKRFEELLALAVFPLIDRVRSRVPVLWKEGARRIVCDYPEDGYCKRLGLFLRFYLKSVRRHCGLYWAHCNEKGDYRSYSDYWDDGWRGAVSWSCEECEDGMNLTLHWPHPWFSMGYFVPNELKDEGLPRGLKILPHTIQTGET